MSKIKHLFGWPLVFGGLGFILYLIYRGTKFVAFYTTWKLLFIMILALIVYIGLKAVKIMVFPGSFWLVRWSLEINTGVAYIDSILNPTLKLIQMVSKLDQHAKTISIGVLRV